MKVVDNGGVAPPRDRHEEVVEQADCGHRPGDADQRPREQHELLAAQQQRAAEKVGAGRNQIVLEREPDRGTVRRAAEPRLRQHRVDADEHGERERQQVDGADAEREPARSHRVRAHPREGNSEEDFLPGLEGGQSAPANSRAVEGGHDRVVRGQADDPRVQRGRRPSPDEERTGHEQEPVHRER